MITCIGSSIAFTYSVSLLPEWNIALLHHADPPINVNLFKASETVPISGFTLFPVRIATDSNNFHEKIPFFPRLKRDRALVDSSSLDFLLSTSLRSTRPKCLRLLLHLLQVPLAVENDLQKQWNWILLLLTKDGCQRSELSISTLHVNQAINPSNKS